MRQNLIRGAGVVAALLPIAAACSGSHHKSHSTTTSTLAGSAAVTTPDGSVVTTPDGSVVTTLIPGGSTLSTSGAPPLTAPGGGVVVTDTNGTPVTNPDGSKVTTPPTSVTTTPHGGTIVTPTTAKGPPVQTTRWKLAVDFRTHPNRNPFPSYLGGAPVWTLLESQSTARDGNYSRLGNFALRFGAPGVAAWHGRGSGCDHPPLIGANTTEGVPGVCLATIPSGAAFVYPDKHRMPVVAWTSPFDGTAGVSAGVADRDPRCGDGIRFYIDLGTTDLASITLVNRDAKELQPITTHVNKGQSLYFIVDAGASGNNACDTTQLALTIDQLS